MKMTLSPRFSAIRLAAVRATVALFLTAYAGQFEPVLADSGAGQPTDHDAGPPDSTVPPQSSSTPGLGLSSETVHRVYGATILGLSTALLLEEVGAFTAPELRYSVPGLVIGAGGLLAIDPLLHGSAAPKDYARETRQHLLLGGLLLAVGGIDLGYEAGWLDHWTWGLALPAGMLATSTSFLFHAQHGDPAQHDLLGAQHRILGATIAVAAIAKGLSAVPAEGGDEPRWPEFRSAWMVAAGLAGVQLLLYTEGGVAPDHGEHTGRSVQVSFTGRGIGVSGAF